MYLCVYKCYRLHVHYMYTTCMLVPLYLHQFISCLCSVLHSLDSVLYNDIIIYLTHHILSSTVYCCSYWNHISSDCILSKESDSNESH